MRKPTHWLCAALILSVAVATATAQEYTSRQEVLQNEDLRQNFTIQGEYLADKMGMHLIADTGGKFRVVMYFGGLPGDGWKAGDPRLMGTATVNGDEITFNLTERRNTTTGELGETKGKVTIETPQRGQGGQGAGQGGTARQGGGQFRGTPVKIENQGAIYERQNRVSTTMGLAAPAGALVLFDGTNVDKWEQGAKINEAPQRQGGGQGGQGPNARPGAGNTLWAEAATKEPFELKPYKMHVEFMLSYMPQAKGQARSNSGVYVDERYECQVLDSFGLEGENNECGGFYTVAKPLVNMCFPPLAWQTYDFEFTPAKYNGNTKTAGARITVKHNGVLIHDNIELKGTPGRKGEGPEPLGVYLQGHGNKVQFRNIWVQYQ